MADLLAFIVELVVESVFSFGDATGSRPVAETIGCLGGSVLYAFTAGRMDLENDDWRSVGAGLLIILVALIGGGLLLVSAVKWAIA